MNEELGNNEQNVFEVERVIAWGEKAVRGEFSGDLNEYEDVGETVPVDGSEGESDILDGVILDLNDTRINESQKKDLKKWIEAKLELGVSEAPVSSKFVSPDQQTTFKIFEKQFGTSSNPWFFSEWQNEGELPSYILWGKEMYDMQAELGYEELEN